MTKLAAASALAVTLLVLLDACGGGGGGSAPPASYPVGGTITGLTPAGLVLANASDTVSPAAGATSFTFGTPVISGASYSVSVQTQPANTTCAVSNGTGTITTAAVTSVQVSCTLNTFQIGGTISGLTAAGLVLANGSDTVNPAANATGFVFATHVTAGNSYNVSVTQQPTGQNCTPANASGTATANVSNVAVTCAAVPVASWSSPAVVGTGVYPPLLANDPSGVAFFVAWCTCTGVVSDGFDATAPALASRYTDAGGWTTPVTMAHGRLTGMQFDAQGKGFALWAAPTGNLDPLGHPDGSVNPMFSRYIPGAGWGSYPMPFAVPLPPVVTPPNAIVFSSLTPLGLSVAGDGTAVALIHEHTSITSSVGNAIFDDDAALAAGAVPGSDILQIGSPDSLFPPSDSSPSTFLDSNGKPVSYFPQVTVWPASATGVVTPSTLPGQYATIYSTVDTVPTTLSNGSPGANTITTRGLAMNVVGGTGSTIVLQTEDLLGENPLARGVYRLGVSNASTAIAANGDALTAWAVIAEDLGSFTVYAQRFVSGAWQARQVVYTSGQDPNYSAFKSVPVAALDGVGNGMIIFPTLGPLTTAAQPLMTVKLNASTGVFSTATQLAAADLPPISLKMDATGNAFMVESSGTSSAVRRYDAAAGTWGTPFSVAGGDPVLALDNTGNAMVAWSAGGSILASRYH